MKLFLTNAGLWPLLALILVPLLLHLFALTRPPVYRFSALDFLLRVVRRTRRIQRPQDWLLWLLRTAAIAALALMFLRPLLLDEQAGDPRAARAVVIVVDASASMAFVEGAQSRFSAACAQAADLLSGLGSADVANVVWLRARPAPVYPRPGVNFGYLREALRQARVTGEPADPRAALDLAADMLAGLPGRREICVISDFQETNWKDLVFEPPPGVQMFMIKAGAAAAENLALTRLTIEPANPLAGEALILHGEAQNFSPRPRQSSVFLTFRDVREKQDLRIEPWGRATVAFSLPPADAGEYPALVSLSEDEFPADNVRRAVIDVQPFLPISLLAAEPETAACWRRALEALPWARVVPMVPGAWPGEDAGDALLLCGWDGAGWEKAVQRLNRGGTVIWYPAPNTPLERIAQVASRRPDAGRDGAARLETAKVPWPLVVAAPDDPCFAVFGGGAHGDPARGAFYGRLRIPPDLALGGVTLLEYPDHVPALQKFERPGMLYLWNLPMQSEMSDWAARPEFLPLLGEMLLTARAGLGEGRDRESCVPGQSLSLRLDREVLAADLRLVNESGEAEPVERRETERGVTFVGPTAETPGLYAWRMGEEQVGYGVVNFPVVESDLRAMDPARLNLEGRALDSGRAERIAQAGLNLWPYLFAAVLIFLTLEITAAVWAART